MSDEDTQNLTPTDLDPPAENLGANAIHVISLVFGGLIRLDANLHVAPDGASSCNVSRAFSLAINREVLANKFLSGQYVPAHTILPPGLPGYEGNIKGETFNPAQANAELAKAEHPNGKGLPRITLSFSGGDAGQTASAQVLQR
jgi:hypothetical protein